MNKDKHNVPVLEVVRGMLETCRDYVLEDKSEEFKNGWLWFVDAAFPFPLNADDYPEKVYLSNDASEDFANGAIKCQKLIEIFYDNATKLIIGDEESEAANNGDYD